MHRRRPLGAITNSRRQGYYLIFDYLIFGNQLISVPWLASARANHWAVRTCSSGRRRGRSCSPSLTSARAGWDRSRATDGASTAATRCTATATRTSRSSVCYSPPRDGTGTVMVGF